MSTRMVPYQDNNRGPRSTFWCFTLFQGNSPYTLEQLGEQLLEAVHTEDNDGNHAHPSV